jgi:FkbM family methyltransferase
MRKVIARAQRVVSRFVATGQIGSSPAPVIRRYFDGGPAFFVQVGSCDGKLGDPLHELIKSNPQWFGIFIEPVDYVFKALVRNYGNDLRYVFEQVAIADEPGERAFYHVSEEAVGIPSVPSQCEQLGSFDRNHILKHGTTLEPYIITRRVWCEPLSSVLDRNKVERVDIIHIDAEGYDYHVLKQIDFSRFSPKLVLYEHTHLKHDESKAAINLLSSHGYRCVNFGMDTLAIRRP